MRSPPRRVSLAELQRSRVDAVPVIRVSLADDDVPVFRISLADHDVDEDDDADDADVTRNVATPERPRRVASPARSMPSSRIRHYPPPPPASKPPPTHHRAPPRLAYTKPTAPPPPPPSRFAARPTPPPPSVPRPPSNAPAKPTPPPSKAPPMQLPPPPPPPSKPVLSPPTRSPPPAPALEPPAAPLPPTEPLPVKRDEPTVAEAVADTTTTLPQVQTTVVADVVFVDAGVATPDDLPAEDKPSQPATADAAPLPTPTPNDSPRSRSFPASSTDAEGDTMDNADSSAVTGGASPPRGIIISSDETAAVLSRLQHTQTDPQRAHLFARALQAASNPSRLLSKAGWLYKSSRKRWPLKRAALARRWFVLAGGVLLYFKDAAASVPKRVVYLAGAAVSLLEAPGVLAGYAVQLDGATSGSMTLYAESGKGETVDWLVALEHNIHALWQSAEEDARLTKALSRRHLASTELPVDAMLDRDVTLAERADVGGGGDGGGGDVDASLGAGAYYELLGVSPSCTADEARRAFLGLAKSLHPDKIKDATADDVALFTLLNRAYDVIKNADTRARYDARNKACVALRAGVGAIVHEPDGETWAANVYLGPAFSVLYWQDAELGPTMRLGYRWLELRYVQEVLSGEEAGGWEANAASAVLVLSGQRMVPDRLVLQLASTAERDEMVAGLRQLRCDRNVLFKQRMEERRARDVNSSS